VQLAMPAGGEEAARRFYRDVLGLAEQPKPPDLAQRGGCWFESDSVRIHLGVDESFGPAVKAYPGLLVKSLKRIVERCRSAGFQIATAGPLEDYDRVYVTDPFGNRIELMERRLEGECTQSYLEGGFGRQPGQTRSSGGFGPRRSSFRATRGCRCIRQNVRWHCEQRPPCRGSKRAPS